MAQPNGLSERFLLTCGRPELGWRARLRGAGACAWIGLVLLCAPLGACEGGVNEAMSGPGTGAGRGGAASAADGSMPVDVPDARAPLAGNPAIGAGRGGGAGGRMAGEGGRAEAGSMASTPDSGSDSGGDPQPDAGPPDPPDGLVPMFVAAGNGGRIVTSCDDGRTWVQRELLANDDEDHSQYTSKGFAYAQGRFIQLIGWGTAATFLISDDGVTWVRRTLPEQGLRADGDGEAGIASTGDGFVLVSNGSETFYSTDRGQSWTEGGEVMNGDESVREVGGGGEAPGVLGAGGTNQTSRDSGPYQPPSVSRDRGQTWTVATGCTSFDVGGLGQYGGAAYGNGRLVFVRRFGGVCSSANLTSFDETSLDTTTDVRGKPAFLDGTFWVPDRDFVHTSDDGLDWIKTALQPAGTRLNAITRSDAGTFAGFDRDSSAFYYSADGLTWQRATGPDPAAGPRLNRILFGHATPSADCPAETP